eukprot:scaffold2854_cov116-Isochrysis_galbana.AAC.4
MSGTACAVGSTAEAGEPRSYRCRFFGFSTCCCWMRCCNITACRCACVRFFSHPLLVLACIGSSTRISGACVSPQKQPKSHELARRGRGRGITGACIGATLWLAGIGAAAVACAADTTADERVPPAAGCAASAALAGGRPPRRHRPHGGCPE